jgi:uncharacterized membrane protein YbhN (UPF0104 family)
MKSAMEKTQGSVRGNGLKFLFVSAIGLLLLSIAIWTLFHKLRSISPLEVANAIRAMPPARIGLAMLLTIVEYFVLTGYDYFGLRYAGARVPYLKVAATAFISDTFNHNIGLTMVTGSSLKFRFYSQFGLSPFQIVKTIGVYTISYWLGFMAMAAGALIAGSFGIGSLMGLSPLYARFIAAAILIIVSIYLGTVLFIKRPLRLFSWQFPCPPPRLAFALLAVACFDWLLACVVFYLLLPPASGILFAAVMTAYLVATFSGIVSQVPGGIAVFESVALLFLDRTAHLASLSATLVVFRAMFYLLPFVCAALLMLVVEIRFAGRMLKGTLRRKR